MTSTRPDGLTETEGTISDALAEAVMAARQADISYGALEATLHATWDMLADAERDGLEADVDLAELRARAHP
jgi:hypothetical protein